MLLNSKKIQKNWFEIILFIFILIGIAIALIDLFHNKSLWLDEACLALNIISRSSLDLLTPLDDGQVAPIGFLLTEKLLTNIFGPHAWVLRLFPFLSFILSIFLFFFLNNRLFKSVKVALLSCALFSLNFELVNYSTEVKQYSIDVLVTILIVISSLNLNIKKTHFGIFLHSFLGAIAIWYSNIAIIILATVTIYNIYFSLMNTTKKEFAIMIPIFIWLISFGIYYILFIYNHPHTNNMTTYWDAHFLPRDIFSTEFYHSFYDKVSMIFAKLLNTNDLWVIPLAFYSIGFFFMITKKKTKYIYLLFMPIIIHLGLSYLHLYPFYDRFLLYIIPLIIIPISYGLIQISNHHKDPYISKIIIICILSIFTINNLMKPQHEEEIKKSLSFINTNISPNDHIYVYYSSTPAFKFYKDNYMNIKQENLIHFGSFARNNPEKYISEITNISNDTWLIFSHMYTEGFPDKPPRTEEQFIIKNLTSQNYIILFEAKFKDSSCYKIRKEN